MIGGSPKCYIPSFLNFGLPILKKSILGIIENGGHDFACDPDFANTFLFTFIGQAVSEKIYTTYHTISFHHYNPKKKSKVMENRILILINLHYNLTQAVARHKYAPGKLEV